MPKSSRRSSSIRKERASMPELLAAHPAIPLPSIVVGNLTLALAPLRETVSIGPFADCLPPLCSALGVTLPQTFTTIGTMDGIQYTRAAHNQWFATAPEGTGLMSRLTAPCASLAALTNQTDSRVILTLGGRGARAIAAKLIPIDLHPTVFTPGSTALTLAGHIPVILAFKSDGSAYDFTVFRSFAQSLHHDIHVAMNGGIPNSERV
uniref:sarcosine oxidase subunit gamma n=1 Tax=Gluconobacter thailandicus TaxID=257438 RepID=UPI0018D44F02|nr:sarcosine oxidase subunit gamma [Gluconobacter thailandicus]